jgi:hypothetical protein
LNQTIVLYKIEEKDSRGQEGKGTMDKIIEGILLMDEEELKMVLEFLENLQVTGKIQTA